MEPKGMKPPIEGMCMPPIMQQLMQRMMEGINEFNPMAMCRAIMSSVSKSAEMVAYATPEVRRLFEDWSKSVDDVLEAEGRR